MPTTSPDAAAASRPRPALLARKLTGWFRTIEAGDLVIVLLGGLLALLIRYALRTFVTEDYLHFTSLWYAMLRDQGWAAFRSEFSDYAPAYLYLLFLAQRLLPGISALTVIKLPSVLFDFACAWFVYRIVKARRGGALPLAAFFTVLFSPTVILNSSAWGQADVIYTTALVACLYFVLREKGWPACIAFGLAFAFKLQAVFLAPFLLALVLRKKIGALQILAVPAVYLASIVPAWIAGRPLDQLLKIYFAQAEGHVYLSMNAPNAYTWISPGFMADDMLLQAGILFAVAICLFYVLLVYKSKTSLTPALIVHMALLSALIVPFFLPRMHERYFYSADILAIVLAFSLPRYYYVAVVVNLASFFVYVPYLFDGYQPVPQPILALFLLAVIVVLARDLVKALHAPAASKESV